MASCAPMLLVDFKDSQGLSRSCSVAALAKINFALMNWFGCAATQQWQAGNVWHGSLRSVSRAAFVLTLGWLFHRLVLFTQDCWHSWKAGISTIFNCTEPHSVPTIKGVWAFSIFFFFLVCVLSVKAIAEQHSQKGNLALKGLYSLLAFSV